MCPICEGQCLQRVAPLNDALTALRELVATRQMREEISRRKQRRLCSITRNPAEVREVARLHQECKVRESRAWNTARAVLARSGGSPS